MLEIRDDGKGIAAAILKESGESWQRSIGVGLRGMKERLGKLGGKLEISSTGNGATVRAMVPAAEPSHA